MFSHLMKYQNCCTTYSSLWSLCCYCHIIKS